MKTSFVCTALLLFGLSSVSQAKEAPPKNKDLHGTVSLLKREAAPTASDSLGVQTDNMEGTQTSVGITEKECARQHGTWKNGGCLLLRESPTKATSSDLQIGTCRSCSGACSSCSPPKCACADISAKTTTGGTEAQAPAATMDGAMSPATADDPGTTAQPAGTIDPKLKGNPKGYDLKANKKL